MILPDVKLDYLANAKLQQSGLDSYHLCPDKKWFRSFPYDVSYQYNSRGFRDSEWPTSLSELRESIWCIGDSFTVGIGSPLDHHWVTLLSKKTNTKTINISMDGASNQWIARKTRKILDVISPKVIVVHWSYLHRYEDLDTTLPDNLRRKHYSTNILDHNTLFEEFSNNVKLVSGSKSTVLQSIIPHTGLITSAKLEAEYLKHRGVDWPLLASQVDNTSFSEAVEFVSNFLRTQGNKTVSEIYEVQQVDYARDRHHYGIVTNNQLCNWILTKI
jgi:predicted SprT family Zn-dependent metalloprotease